MRAHHKIREEGGGGSVVMLKKTGENADGEARAKGPRKRVR